MNEGKTSQEVMDEPLFDDEPDFESDEPTEGDETEEQTASTEPKAKEPEGTDEDVPDFLTIRYNKQDLKLSKAEAIALAQKGKNYDHVADELKSYREGPIGRALSAYAKEAGMSVEQYAEMMTANMEAAQEKAAIEKLEEEHPDWPLEALKELVKAQRAGAKAQAKSAEEAKRQKEWAEAHAAYPEITPDNLPQDVLEAVAQGMTPLDALREHTIAELRAKVAELTSAKEQKEKQDQNRARSTGSLASVDKGKVDDFLAEFA